MFEVILTAILASGVTTGSVVMLAKTWLEARVKASIELEYKKQFELFQRQLNQQQKVELVAELLGELLATRAEDKAQQTFFPSFTLAAI